MAPIRRRRLLDEKEISPDKDGDDAKGNSSGERKISDILGSRWDTDELTLFYNSYRVYGKDWTKVASTLQNRSPEMVEALFMMNKAYLSLPNAYATAAGLCAMMTDHYNNLVESIERGRENNGAGSSKKSKKLARGRVHPTTSEASDEKVVLNSPTIKSKDECLELLRKKCSEGTWSHPVRQRSRRFAIAAPYENDGLELRADIDGYELAHEIGIDLAGLSQKDGSLNVSQTPSKRLESPLRLLQRKYSMKDMEKNGLLNAEVDLDVLEGRSRLKTCNLSGHKPNTLESVGSMVAQKGIIPDDGKLQILATVSLMMSNDSEAEWLEELIRSSGEEEDLLSNQDLQSSKKLKPAKDAVFGIDSIPDELEDLHLPPIKPRKNKQKSPLFKVQSTKARTHRRSPGIEVENKKVTYQSRVSAQNNPPRSMKYDNPPSANVTKEGIDSPQSYVHVPETEQANLPTSLRNRHRKKLRKSQGQKQIKLPYKISTDQAQARGTLSNCLCNQRLRTWCTFEWFYSPIDYRWFNKREFVDYLDHVRLGHVQRLTRLEWGIIRSSLGKPRRFSEKFLNGEIEKLNEYRDSVRKYYCEIREGVREGLPADIARPLSVGQYVIAIHPKTREIHDGSVLTVYQSKYRIQFNCHELGVEFVKDIDCMPVSKECTKLSPNLNIGNRISQSSALANPSHFLKQTKTGRGPADTTTHQRPSYSEPDTINMIMAKEANAQAISDLNRALAKKEALICELRHMNNDIHRDSTLTVSDLYKEQRTVLLTQLSHVNKQISAASSFLMEIKSYHGKSPFTQPTPLTNLTDCDNTCSSLNDFASTLQESEVHVNEILDSSRIKAKTMVDAAVQGLSSFKRSKDTTDKREDALDYVNNQLSSGDSSMSREPNSKLSESSNIEALIPSELIRKCVETLLMIQNCTERRLPPSDVAQMLQSAVASLQPRSAQNQLIYTDIQRCIGIIKNQIIALIPKKTVNLL